MINIKGKKEKILAVAVGTTQMWTECKAGVFGLNVTTSCDLKFTFVSEFSAAQAKALLFSEIMKEKYHVLCFMGCFLCFTSGESCRISDLLEIFSFSSFEVEEPKRFPELTDAAACKDRHTPQTMNPVCHVEESAYEPCVNFYNSFGNEIHAHHLPPQSEDSKHIRVQPHIFLLRDQTPMSCLSIYFLSRKVSSQAGILLGTQRRCQQQWVLQKGVSVLQGTTKRQLCLPDSVSTALCASLARSPSCVRGLRLDSRYLCFHPRALCRYQQTAACCWSAPSEASQLLGTGAIPVAALHQQPWKVSSWRARHFTWCLNMRLPGWTD